MKTCRAARLTACALVVSVLAACGQKQTETQTEQRSGFHITGTIEGVKDGQEIYLRRRDRTLIAAASITGGRFALAGAVDYPQPALLRIENAENPQAVPENAYGELVLENAEYQVTTGDIGLVVTGGEYTDRVFGYTKLPEYIAAVKEQRRVEKAVFPDDLDMMDQAAVERARALYGEAEEAVFAIRNEYQREILEGDSPALLKVLVLGGNQDWQRYDMDKRGAMMAEYEKELGEHPLIARFKERKRRDDELAAIHATLAIGKPFKEITAWDVDGKALKLSQTLAANKLVLVDFWASWCGPCRGEFPHLKKVYDEFRDRGFEIYAVSIDEDKQEWLKALEEENVPWINLVDTAGIDSKVAKDYGIEGVPANYLVAADGTILASNLREWEVEKAVREKLAKAERS